MKLLEIATSLEWKDLELIQWIQIYRRKDLRWMSLPCRLSVISRAPGVPLKSHHDFILVSWRRRLWMRGNAGKCTVQDQTYHCMSGHDVCHSRIDREYTVLALNFLWAFSCRWDALVGRLTSVSSVVETVYSAIGETRADKDNRFPANSVVRVRFKGE
jgi:hypothetical protein